MIKTRFLSLISIHGALLICNAVLPQALAADDAALNQQGLSRSIERQTMTLNVNQVGKYVIDFNFSTFHGMYAYRELLLWAQAAPEQQRSELMAMTRAGLEAVVCHSGMGLPLGPGEAQPVGLLFGRGLPRYGVLPDPAQPATLKWDAASFDRQIGPESVGQSLAAKSLYVLADDASDDGKKLRQTLAASAVREYQSILPLLELGGEKGAGYMPALLKLENDKWTVVNASSRLYGQMSLIQGLSHLYAMLSLSALDKEPIGGKRASEWRKEVRRTLEKVFLTTMKLHLDAKAGSLVGSHDRVKGASDRLGADEAGYALEVLADLVGALPKDDPLRETALNRLTAQADYVLAARLEGKAIAPKAFLVKNNQPFAGMLLLEDQLAIVDGLLAAEQATGREQYGKAALAIFNTTREILWSAPAGIFRSAAGHWVTAYDGRLFGLALATWRRLEKSLPPGEAREHGERLIATVVKRAGLLQAEGPGNGEPKQPEAFIRDELPQLVSSLTALKKQEQAEKIAAAVKALSDQDGDGVPGIRFAGGRFGAAPVLIIQTSVKTPFATPPVAETPTRSTP
jgi:hypothetical protein